jgi:hypothetical protein
MPCPGPQTVHDTADTQAREAAWSRGSSGSQAHTPTHHSPHPRTNGIFVSRHTHPQGWREGKTVGPMPHRCLHMSGITNHR